MLLAADLADDYIPYIDRNAFLRKHFKAVDLSKLTFKVPKLDQKAELILIIDEAMIDTTDIPIGLTDTLYDI